MNVEAAKDNMRCPDCRTVIIYQYEGGRIRFWVCPHCHWTYEPSYRSPISSNRSQTTDVGHSQRTTAGGPYRDKSEYLQHWREKNREHLREYQRQYRKQFRTSSRNSAGKSPENHRDKPVRTHEEQRT